MPSKSIDHPDYPETKKAIRGVLYIGGWAFNKIGDNLTLGTYMSEGDMNG
jgi:hypothetical protein